ncbi:hypothetical protein [Rhodococcus erythropolis]|nr:hypothetical protein [Rhodococcus erythropolis]SUE12263.1 Uncharacterised protein [Rhodococcus erythropolis]
MKTVTAALYAVRRLPFGAIALVLLLSGMVLMPELQMNRAGKILGRSL